LRPLGPSLSWLRQNAEFGATNLNDFDRTKNEEVTNMEYVIVFGVAAMMGLYVLILGRCLKNA
jgi:hypothetical protein